MQFRCQPMLPRSMNENEIIISPWINFDRNHYWQEVYLELFICFQTA
ncbi:unnamed protein product [Larinioides sclopetarius]|uniref:Uncharacterized protein n=1 Tax=Larinioides sclopetarius TaxID=280406 RepID=A0AAV2AS93_9ARAC